MAYTIENNKPTIGSIRWASLNMTYKGTSYAITDGYTNYSYAYWTTAYPNNLIVTNTFPTLGEDDCLIFLNKSGIATTVPKTTVYDGDLLVPGSITANAIAANTITGDEIMAGAISANEIAANAIGADKIAAGAVIADKIAAGAISADKIATNAVTAAKIDSGAISATHLSSDLIEAGKIKADKIATNIAQVNKDLVLGSDSEHGSLQFYSGAQISSYFYSGQTMASLRASAYMFDLTTVYNFDFGTTQRTKFFGNVDFAAMDIVGLKQKIAKLPTDISGFTNGWSSHATYKAKYSKTPEGIVMLEGLIVGGNAGNMALLPSGYRPKAAQIVYVPTYTGAMMRIQITTAGYLYFDNIGGPYLSYICLNGISFVEASAVAE